MNVGAAIYACRLERGLTQRELARRALLTPANLSAIESGRRDLTVQTLLRIARVLKTPAGRLVDDGQGVIQELGRFQADAVARAAISGRRNLGRDLNRLANGLAWICRPPLSAAVVAGRVRGSHLDWRRATLLYSRPALEQLQDRVRKLLPSTEARSLAQ